MIQLSDFSINFADQGLSGNSVVARKGRRAHSRILNFTNHATFFVYFGTFSKLNLILVALATPTATLLFCLCVLDKQFVLLLLQTVCLI